MKANLKSLGAYCFLFFFILIIFSGCEINTPNETKQKEEDIFNIEKEPDLQQKRGGSVRLSSIKVDTFNPLLSFDKHIKRYSDLMYDSLYKIDEKQIARKSLVKSHELSKDGLVWKLKLRDDVSWHNGYLLSAKDVKFTFDILSNAQIDSIYKNNVDGIKSFSVIDDTSFKITTESKDMFLPWKLTFPILSWSDYIEDELENDIEDESEDESEKDLEKDLEKNTKRPPVGTGAYRVLGYIPDEKLILERNEIWWGNNEFEQGYPFLDRVEILFFDSYDQEIRAFKNRQIDIVFLNEKILQSFKNRKDINFEKYTSNKFEFLAFNLKSESFIKMDAVRRAIYKAIDRTRIINLLVQKDLSIDNVPIVSQSFLNDKFLPHFVVNQKKALHILFEEGFLFENDYFSKMDEEEAKILEIKLLVNEDNTNRVMIAENIKEQLKEIGIKIEIVLKNRVDYFNDLMGNNYELALTGVALADHIDLESLYSSKGSGINIAGYESIKMDNILLQLKQANSLEEKQELSEDLRNLISEDVPYIGLFFYNEGVAYNRDIFGDIEPRYWNKLNDFKSFAVKRKE